MLRWTGASGTELLSAFLEMTKTTLRSKLTLGTWLYNMLTNAFASRCEYRALPITRGPHVNDVTPPMLWDHQEFELPKEQPQDFSEDEFLELHKILSLEKFIPLSSALLRSMLFSLHLNTI